MTVSQFWSNEVHSPTGKAGRLDLCHGTNNTLHGPLLPAAATHRAASILAPYPMPGAPRPAVVCPNATTPVKQHYSGTGLVRALTTTTHIECQVACCAEEQCFLWNWDSNLLPSARARACNNSTSGCCWLIAIPGAPGCDGRGACCGVGRPGCLSWSGLVGRATLKLRSTFASHMVLQHGVVSRIAGSVVGLSASLQAGINVSVDLDGVVVGHDLTAADGAFHVVLPAQAVSVTPHTLIVSVVAVGATPMVRPVVLTDILFGKNCNSSSTV